MRWHQVLQSLKIADYFVRLKLRATYSLGSPGCSGAQVPEREASSLSGFDADGSSDLLTAIHSMDRRCFKQLPQATCLNLASVLAES